MTVGFVKARTHGPEYSWHKYWSRKPANVIRAYIDDLCKSPSVIVDPFAGSGVVLREGKALGHEVIGFDVNPIAHAIQSFMISSLDPEEFRVVANEILATVEEKFGHLYESELGRVRYCVHHVITKCISCNTVNEYSLDVEEVRRKRCINCDKKLTFAIKSMVSTRIKGIQLMNKSFVEELDACVTQENISNSSPWTSQRFNSAFVNNKRTLTSSDLRTSDYFTPRNFRILCEFAAAIDGIENSRMKNALKLLVTSTSAQASRLIASRGRLSTGGQAWTIPGFWVPPIHIESNPFIHLASRIKKIEAALVALQGDDSCGGSAKPIFVSAIEGVEELLQESVKADLIFLDPPYGDSVAFTEFSALWNSFLEVSSDYKKDISVSDRTDFPLTMDSYEEYLSALSVLCERLLTQDGKILLTFNNSDLSAWRAIVAGLQQAGFSAQEVRYQDPAVVSSKAQKALDGSYVGDFYVVFSRSSKKLSTINDSWLGLSEVLRNAALIRNNHLSEPLAIRFALTYFLEENVDAREISDLQLVFDELFIRKSKNLTLRLPGLNHLQISQMLGELVGAHNRDEHFPFYEDVKRIFQHCGIPSAIEIETVLLAASKANTNEPLNGKSQLRIEYLEN